jgi:leucyl aminopeptidase
MLTLTADATDPLAIAADLLIVPAFKGGIEGPGTTQVLDALGLESLPSTPDFRGDIGQHLLLAAPGLLVGGVLVVGLGRMDETDAERLRRAAAVAARAARGAERVATTLAQVHPSAANLEAVAEGFWLGAYEDRRFKNDPVAATSGGRDDEPARLREVVVLAPSSRLWDARLALRRARSYAEAVYTARDLVNLPPGHKRPAELADRCAELLGGTCEVTVHDEQQLAERGFGGILAVGRGSAAPPRLVEARYRPDQPLGHVVLVGKGITFDTGGLSLKSSAHQLEMKSDMAGAAAVVAAMSVLADLNVRLEVTGLLPLAENMPGADAQRPDDVIRMVDGTTVEVIDTDAEGRLVLADALAYGATLGPEAMVDLATLTGSVITALGHYAAGALGTDPDLLASVQAAAEVVGEDVWPLPLYGDLEPGMRSTVADWRNIGDDDAGGGAIVAALFLKRFTGQVPWVHLDIAGPAFLRPSLARDHRPAGGTGFGVRTLLAWLERRGA